jgi:hypothetical protein
MVQSIFFYLLMIIVGSYWVYFLKSKYDVFVEFVKFKAAVELET